MWPSYKWRWVFSRNFNLLKYRSRGEENGFFMPSCVGGERIVLVCKLLARRGVGCRSCCWIWHVWYTTVFSFLLAVSLSWQGREAMRLLPVDFVAGSQERTYSTILVRRTKFEILRDSWGIVSLSTWAPSLYCSIVSIATQRSPSAVSPVCHSLTHRPLLFPASYRFQMYRSCHHAPLPTGHWITHPSSAIIHASWLTYVDNFTQVSL